MAIKAVAGKLPVNLIVVAEGDEERMSIGLRQFVQDPSRAVQGRRGAVERRRPGYSGRGGISVGRLRRLRLRRDHHQRREVGPRADGVGHPRRQQAQRRQPGLAPHQVLSSLISETATRQDRRLLRRCDAADARSSGQSWSEQAEVDRHEDGGEESRRRAVHRPTIRCSYMKDRNWISFNLDGIWGGNMYAGGAGAILPNKITSKHNIRYVPNMKGPDLVEKMKKQLSRTAIPTST